MRPFVMSMLACLVISGCVSFGPADGQLYVKGSVPDGSSCTLSVAVAGSTGSPIEREVAGKFRESFIVHPSRQGHVASLRCGGAVVATRAFKYGKDVHIGGELAIGGVAP